MLLNNYFYYMQRHNLFASKNPLFAHLSLARTQCLSIPQNLSFRESYIMKSYVPSFFEGLKNWWRVTGRKEKGTSKTDTGWDQIHCDRKLKIRVQEGSGFFSFSCKFNCVVLHNPEDGQIDRQKTGFFYLFVPIVLNPCLPRCIPPKHHVLCHPA